MALERQPKSQNLEAMKGYKPADDKVFKWHPVVDGRQENFTTIAATYGVPVERIIEFNFPGSVEDGRVIPEIVNWYLHYHKDFGCPETYDRINRIFKGGERIAIPRLGGMTGSGPQWPTLGEVKKWFEEKVIPLRTAAAGFSMNRVWKSPRGVIAGNVEDPNGLCGDASFFVSEEYNRQFKTVYTSDGYVMGAVLWEGGSLQQNHIANVMLLAAKSGKENYIYNSSTQQIELLRPPTSTVRTSTVGAEPITQYSTDLLFGLWVLDLYYKMPPQTLRFWWARRDSSLSGTITIGQPQDFAE
jgi:hypothetical protein